MRASARSNMKTARSKAEQQFSATQKKDEKAIKEKENAKKEAAGKVARLRALRLKKKDADRTVAREVGSDEPLMTGKG